MTTAQAAPSRFTAEARAARAAERAAAIDAATLSEIEALAAGDTDDLPTAVRIRQDGEVRILAVASAASAFMGLATGAKPLTKRQIAAALRLQRAFRAGRDGGSNASAIERHASQRVQSTKADRDARAFGRVMSVRDDSRALHDAQLAIMDAAQFRVFVQRRVGRVTWALLEMAIDLDMAPREIAGRLDASREYVADRLREALAELAGAVSAYDASHDDQPDPLFN